MTTLYKQVKATEKGQMTLEIWRDHDCEGPRENPISAFWSFEMHRNYDFHEKAADDVLARIRHQAPAKAQHDDLGVVAWLSEFQTADSDYAAVPVFMLDHSGLAFSAGSFADSWDSGLIGWLIIDRERWAKEHGGEWSHDTAINMLKREIIILNDFHQCGAYGYTLTETESCECCQQQKPDPIADDSVGGFYGANVKDDIRGYLPEEARTLIDGWE